MAGRGAGGSARGGGAESLPGSSGRGVAPVGSGGARAGLGSEAEAGSEPSILGRFRTEVTRGGVEGRTLSGAAEFTGAGGVGSLSGLSARGTVAAAGSGGAGAGRGSEAVEGSGTSGPGGRPGTEGAGQGSGGAAAAPPGGGAASASGGAAGGGSGPPPVEPGPWADYPAGPAFLAALADGRAPRAVWTALPGPDWCRAVAVAVAVCLRAGRGAVVVVADGRAAARLDAALSAELGAGRHVVLTAELGPAERYRRWLAALRGQVRAVVGTRAATYAPVADLGLVVLWDDGDDVHAEPHAPYPHPRAVLALRAHQAGAAVLFGGVTRTADTAQLIASGWARPLEADRATVRRRAPQVRIAGEDSELARDPGARTARLPSLALRVARSALEHGPVLVQVPRRGYLPSLACASCREPARCAHCAGPLALRSSHAMPYCRWCGRIAAGWRCPECDGAQVRARVVGARRTAEEIGRAFPQVRVRTSGRDEILDRVGPEPALVVSTPGAEPVAEGGYAAALLLDGWVLLGRADLRATEEALRRWLNAAALVRPAPDGGQVVLLADPQAPAAQAAVRWDPGTLAERELAERAELGFPPAVRMASLTGDAASVRELLDLADLPSGAEVLGPVALPQDAPALGRPGGAPDGVPERALVRVPHAAGAALAAAVKAAVAARSARGEPPVRVQVDPSELL
ncbi:primosome assembly protein PriA [Allonocardiopsis opalescens]|uniref:primosome assembly protein PriA n=1 Tax=Allonocardiopsis opalescens TaxID=1144618 RepID=UPI003CCBFDCF